MSKHILETADFGILGFYLYKGCLVEKINSGFKVLGQYTLTPKGVDRIIDEANISIQKSLK